MIHYSIIHYKGKFALEKWQYERQFDVFHYQLGSSSKWHKVSGDKPFEREIASCFPESVEYGLFLNSYPENNRLVVRVNNGEKVSKEEIFGLKGFKKFFDHMNITDIYFKKSGK